MAYTDQIQSPFFHPSTHPCPQSSQSLVIITLFSGQCILASTYDREYVIPVFLCLAYFIQYNVLQFHPFFCKWQNFILLYGSMGTYNTFCLFIHPLMPSGWFHILGTVNNAVITMVCSYLFRCWFHLLWYIPKCGTAGTHMVDLFLVFWGTSILRTPLLKQDRRFGRHAILSNFLQGHWVLCMTFNLIFTELFLCP
jgi:hypothetical protein